MSRSARDPACNSRAPKLDVQRIKVDEQGYDDTGAYWGAGPDVYIVATAEGEHEVTVRAATIAEARRKAAAELARRPGEPRSEPRAPIGGTSPHKSRFEIEWHNPVSASNVRIRITHSRDYLVAGTDHIEIEAIKPKRTALPITETGYLSHFIDWQQLSAAGGPVTFVTAWLEREAHTKAWRQKELGRAQGDLFAWADAHGEVGARRKPRSARPATKARRKPARDRAPE